MPKLRFLDRQWYFGGDDLSLLALWNIGLRTIWISILSTVIMFPNLVGRAPPPATGECPELGAYLFGVISIFTVAIACEIQVFRISIRGSIVDYSPRTHLPFFLGCHMVLGALSLCMAVYGWCFVLRPSISCRDGYMFDSLLHTFLFAVVASGFVDSSAWAFAYFLLSQPYAPVQLGVWESTANEEWLESRCKFFCRAAGVFSCNIFGGRFSGDSSDDFSSIASIVTRVLYHGGMVDIVPSDVLAGMALVVLQQKAAATRGLVGYASLGGSSSMRPREHTVYRPLVPGNAEDRAVVDDLAHYSPYAIAVYSVIMYLFVYPLTGVCRLTSFACVRCFSWCCSRSGAREMSSSSDLSEDVVTNFDSPVNEDSVVVGDCLSCHKNALQKMLESRRAELKFASFLNDTVAKPYSIMFDHSRNAVVISIRGTLSLDDCVADVVAHSVELAGHGQRWGFDGEGRYAHGGMLRSAEWLLDDLRQKGSLEAALEEVNGSREHGGLAATAAMEIGSGRESESEKLYRREREGQRRGAKQYDIVIVGHSFGAGVAMLVAMSLRSRYPTVRCIGMGMPSAVVDARTAEDAKAFTRCIIQGSDLVSRLSMQALAKMRAQVLDAIARARANKFVIMQAFLRGDADESTLSQLLHSENNPPRSEFSDQIFEFLRVVTATEEESNDIELFMPGRIFHMEVDEQDASCPPRRPQDVQVQPSLAERGMHDYRDVYFHHRMAVDHFPHIYIQNIDAIRTKWSDRYTPINNDEAMV